MSKIARVLAITALLVLGGAGTAHAATTDAGTVHAGTVHAATVHASFVAGQGVPCMAC